MTKNNAKAKLVVTIVGIGYVDVYKRQMYWEMNLDIGLQLPIFSGMTGVVLLLSMVTSPLAMVCCLRRYFY